MKVFIILIRVSVKYLCLINRLYLFMIFLHFTTAIFHLYCFYFPELPVDSVLATNSNPTTPPTDPNLLPSQNNNPYPQGPNQGGGPNPGGGPNHPVIETTWKTTRELENEYNGTIGLKKALTIQMGENQKYGNQSIYSAMKQWQVEEAYLNTSQRDILANCLSRVQNGLYQRTSLHSNILIHRDNVDIVANQELINHLTAAFREFNWATS
jgi:hypothetical protein